MNENLDYYLAQHMRAEAPSWTRSRFEGEPLQEGLAIWPPQFDPPPAGSRVLIQAWRESADDPGIPGTIIGYEVFHRYLMVWVKPDWRPKWHIEQNPGRWAGLFAGIELEPL